MAFLQAMLGGKESPGAADIEKILSSVGIEAESGSINKLLGELKGEDVLEVIARGREKLAAVPSGGGGVVASGGGGGGGAAPGGGGGGGGGAAAAVEEKEPEKEASESDEDMGMSLFD